MADVSGDFEIHITTDPGHAETLATFAEQYGMAFVHIVLDRGSHESQPMLTLTGRGVLDQQLELADGWVGRLRAAGVPPIRTKVEAAPWCVGVPRSDADVATGPKGRYFEHHVKL